MRVTVCWVVHRCAHGRLGALPLLDDVDAVIVDVAEPTGVESIDVVDVAASFAAVVDVVVVVAAETVACGTICAAGVPVPASLSATCGYEAMTAMALA